MAIVSVQVGYSTSPKYPLVISIMTRLPHYSKYEGFHSIIIDDIMEFIQNQEKIEQLIQIVCKWKTAEVVIGGKKTKSPYIYNLLDKELFGKYAILLDNSSYVDRSIISYEHLPLPFVYYPQLYGAFFGFADDIGGDIIFCECEREAIMNYISLRKQKPLKNYVGSKTYPLGTDMFPLEVANRSLDFKEDITHHIHFQPNICFRCNHQIPKLPYCHAQYGGLFKQKYGWYIQQEYFKLGVDKYDYSNVLDNKCPPKLMDTLKDISTAKQSPSQENAMALVSQLSHDMENTVREQFGYPKIGDSWIGETLLHNIVKELFPNKTILRHYRPDWLEGLEIDTYVLEEKLGFEYQGVQHYQPVEHWGGIKQFLIQQEHDKRKKKLCSTLNVRLICVKYTEKLTFEHILNKIGYLQQY